MANIQVRRGDRLRLSSEETPAPFDSLPRRAARSRIGTTSVPPPSVMEAGDSWTFARRIDD